MTASQLNAVSLFAGVGGLDLACERAGIKVTAAVEIDKAARSVLGRRFPDTRLYEDVTRVHAATTCRGCDDCLPAGRVDLVCGGFPCQDLSVAGRRAGLAGLRSGLFYELARIISETTPRWIVLENVPGLLSSSGGRDMAAVVGTLGDLGYGWAYRVLDAQFFGVPQRRRRVFVVGCLGDRAAPVQILLEPEGGDGNLAESWPSRQDLAGTLGGGSGSRGWAPDTDRMTFVPVAAKTLTTSSQRQDYETETFVTVAATSTGGTSAKPGVNPPGRRQEDDVNIVTFRKAARAQTTEDDESWVPDTVTNTLNTFDVRAARAVDLVVAPLQEVGARTGVSTDDPRAGIGIGAPGDPMFTLQAGKQHGVGDGVAVRRLTPMECERLQGFPDGWTEGQSDSPRYKQMGNAVAVPVVEWIMGRLVAVASRLAQIPRDGAVFDEHAEGVHEVGAEAVVAEFAGDSASVGPERIGDADVA